MLFCVQAGTGPNEKRLPGCVVVFPRLLQYGSDVSVALLSDT